MCSSIEYISDFRVDNLTSEDRISSDKAVNKNSYSNSQNPEASKKRSRYSYNVQKYIVKDTVDLVVDKHLFVPEALRVTFDVCIRQNLYHAVNIYDKKMFVMEGMQVNLWEHQIDGQYFILSSKIKEKSQISETQQQTFPRRETEETRV